ncbi:MAG: helix-turn-helix transcriptional regulator [Lachnospiraceae bacterium]|nr:helix-turn-helix transcriptional regulator [Lachnospiraceae bacterium]
MNDWTNYKNTIRSTAPMIGRDLDEVEEISKIVGAMIEQRHSLNMSQRDLAELCNIPHSSIARIESGKSTPNLSTLIRIFHQLGLRFSVQQDTEIRRHTK